VYFVEEHNFHVEWHLRFGVEMREKAWSTLVVTVHQRSENSQVGMHFCTNGGEKDPTPLVKVVEDQEIYNFGIQVFVHYSSIFWRKTQSKCASLSYFWLLAL
jgi:GDP-D-mannose dehydratase